MMKLANDINPTPEHDRRPYAAPEIVLEIDLETRAGTPLSIGGNDPLDLTGLGTNDNTP